MRIAVIDLGTNTFNLLIADVNASNFNIVHNSKEGVALGMGGINEKTIHSDAEMRATDAFEKFSSIIKSFHVDKAIGFGTSAIRDAYNGKEFALRLEERFGIPIEIIDGKREAELIYKGVTWIVEVDKPALIMDIGGGSTEFIRVSKNEEIQSCSLDIGVSRAYQSFQFQDPLSEEDCEKLLAWFEEKSDELTQFSNCTILIGASGSFETFYEMVHNEVFPSKMESIYLEKEELTETLNWTLKSTHSEREDHPFIIPIRRKMAPIAAMKTKWVLDKFGIDQVIICPFSLKEGVLREIAEQFLK